MTVIVRRGVPDIKPAFAHASRREWRSSVHKRSNVLWRLARTTTDASANPIRRSGVPLHDSPGVAHILRREELELVRPARDLLDERHLRLVADSISNQVVQFRENKGRDNARWCRGDKCRDCAAVQRFVRVKRGVEPARVQHDHRTPKPSSARSTSSAIDGPVERKSGSLGTGASASPVSRDTASRSSSASLHRRCGGELSSRPA